MPVLVLGVYIPQPLHELLTHGGGRVDEMKQSMNRTELKKKLSNAGPDRCNAGSSAGSACEVTCARAALPELCGRLFLEWDFSFAGLIVEEGASEWQLRYVFYGERDAGWVHVLVTAPLAEKTFPSIVKFVHAADWHEREAEDLFGLIFEGHPRLGDFILHDDAWQEGVEPMRHQFDATSGDAPSQTGRRLASASHCPGAGRVRDARRPEIFRRDRVGSFSARNRWRRCHPLHAAPVLQVARD